MNFPISRGVVLGLLTGYTCLSVVIITQLYYALYEDDSKFLIFLMAWLPIAAVFLFLPVIRIHKTVQQPNDTKVLYKFLYLTLALVGFLMFVTLLQQFFTFSQFEYQITTTMTLLLLILPLSVVIVVSLTSIWIYLGKVVQGVVSEFIILKYRVPRPLMLTSLLLLSCVGHLLVAFNFPNGLYVASIVIGFCYGANWPLIYSVISELFGLKHYSTLYNLGSLAGPIGSYLLGVRVAGYLYDKEAMRQIEAMGKKTSPGEELNCNGEECFKLAFIITTAVSLFGALLSLILVFRTKQLYRSDLYKKYKEAKTDETETGVLQQD